MQEDQSKLANPVQVDVEENEEEEDAGEDVPERIEEMKLRAKFPQVARGPPSAFLQKRLQQRKFFDSGDYNMAKQKGGKMPPGLAQKPAAPTATMPKQKEELAVLIDEAVGPNTQTGMVIPTPEKIPARKTSIVQSSASKLSPQPLLLHHSPTSIDGSVPE